MGQRSSKPSIPTNNAPIVHLSATVMHNEPFPFSGISIENIVKRVVYHPDVLYSNYPDVNIEYKQGIEALQYTIATPSGTPSVIRSNAITKYITAENAFVRNIEEIDKRQRIYDDGVWTTTRVIRQPMSVLFQVGSLPIESSYYSYQMYMIVYIVPDTRNVAVMNVLVAVPKHFTPEQQNIVADKIEEWALEDLEPLLDRAMLSRRFSFSTLQSLLQRFYETKKEFTVPLPLIAQ